MGLTIYGDAPAWFRERNASPSSSQNHQSTFSARLQRLFVHRPHALPGNSNIAAPSPNLQSLAGLNFNPTQWKNNPLQYNAAGHGSISAGPYIHNIVTFEPGIYRTSDFHCEPAFLNCFANVYPKVDKMMSTDITKQFSQFDTAVRHKGIPGAVLRQVLNPKLRDGKLPVHYLGKVQEFMDHAFDEMDPPQIILPPALNNEFREKAEAVEAILQSEFNKPLMLADLAQRVATNLTYLQRAFKERYNITVTQYLHNVRIEKVKQYLLDTTDGLETIAGLTQFHDASHLSSKFKSATGKTPTDFRNSWKK